MHENRSGGRIECPLAVIIGKVYSPITVGPVVRIAALLMQSVSTCERWTLREVKCGVSAAFTVETADLQSE